MLITREVLLWILAIVAIIIIAAVFINGGIGTLSDKVMLLFGQFTP